MQGKKNKWLMCGIFQQNQKRVWANLGIRIIKGIQKIVSLNIGRFLSFFYRKEKNVFHLFNSGSHFYCLHSLQSITGHSPGSLSCFNTSVVIILVAFKEVSALTWTGNQIERQFWFQFMTKHVHSFVLFQHLCGVHSRSIHSGIFHSEDWETRVRSGIQN